MLNKLQKLREERAQGEHGFTLIELLVVVVIIGILIAIAIPLYLNYKKGANDKAAQSDVRNAVAILEQCNTDNNGYPKDLGAAANNAYATLTGCAGQRINTSPSTGTFTYTSTGCTGNVCTGYTLLGSATSGSGKKYTYDSSTGQTTVS
ncbi:MAG TPA: prepilin-type N-terminal cleavage/methylation domain-containing protein [Jatrophihabitans sp.]|nr:prepilin-type N-terminal cleavage/methylation domain-containing protein [Jatrophihabitans sp.]